MKRISLLLYFVQIFFLSNAQPYADKSFYLVDSLVLEDIDSYNKNLLDSTLQLYHASADDTIQLAYIDFLLSNISIFELLWKYNDFMFEKANECFLQAKNKKQKQRIKFYIATSYGNKGTLYSFENADDSTFHYYTKALNAFSEIEAYSGMANMNGSLGVFYDIKGEVKKALKYYNDGLKFAELSGDNQSIGMALLNVASIQKDYREYDKALENGNRAIKFCLLAEDNQTLVMGYLLIANVYYRLTEFEKAKSIALKALDVCEKINSAYWAVDAHNLLGRTYYALGEIDSAEIYYKQVQIEAEELNADDVKMIALHGLSRIAILKEDYTNAERYATEAQEIATELKSKDYISKSAQILSKIFERKRDYKKALEYMHTYDVLKDSLHNSETQKDAIKLGIQYDYEKEVALVEQEKVFAQELAAKNRNLFIAAIIVGLALSLLAMFFIYQQQLKKRAELAEVKLIESESKLQLERKLNDAEMKALKAQMNPHFLFNAFNSIQEFIILNNRELASDYLGKFADLMRLYLDHSREKSISLENEINATSLYLELEKIRFEDTLTYSIEVAKNIDTSSLKIPPMLIQPFIENSLKHGLLHKKDKRQLKLKFELEKETIICSVEDNGIGRKASAALNEKRLKKHQSFATSATQNRIELLNIGRTKDISLQIIDLTDEAGNALGTKVEIRIPLV